MTLDKPKILLATDMSELAFNTAKHLSSFFAHRPIEVVLFHVWNPIPKCFLDQESNAPSLLTLSDYFHWSAQLKIRIEKHMTELVKLILERSAQGTSVRFKTYSKTHGVAKDILLEAEFGYDGVVIGSRHENLDDKTVLGRIATELVSHLKDIPLFIVGGAPNRGKVLVANDTSRGIKKTLDDMSALGKGTNWQVRLFSAERAPELETDSHVTSIDAVFTEALGAVEKEGDAASQ